MMRKNTARLYSAELEGVEAKIIEVEADVNVGLHRFDIVGLADKALNEAKERVNSALKNSGVKPPNRENRRITINLAPADIRKNGSHYDLCIALGYLLATKQIASFSGDGKIFLGELALDGRLRPILGALNIAEAAARAGFEFIFLPAANADEGAMTKNIKVISVGHITDVISFLENRRAAAPHIFIPRESYSPPGMDFSEIKEQENAKRALIVAASGRHNILLTGPPGVGKSFLAQSMTGIVPALSENESIEVAKIWSAAGASRELSLRNPPFRAPHQTISLQALIGGGAEARPGEISLAHRGILFLDELPEFHRNALESLREPLENGSIRITRTRYNIVLPARFMLVAAMNPCPCGYFGDPEISCKCSSLEVMRYQRKISGPLMDRIDMQIKLGRVALEKLHAGDIGISTNSRSAKKSVERGIAVQKQRFGAEIERSNASIRPKELFAILKLDASAERFLSSLKSSYLSPRSYHRLLKVSRTIADIDEKENVSENHLAEAFGYRLREN